MTSHCLYHYPSYSIHHHLLPVIDKCSKFVSLLPLLSVSVYPQREQPKQSFWDISHSMSCPAHTPPVTSHHSWSSIQRPHGDLHSTSWPWLCLSFLLPLPQLPRPLFCSTNSSGKALPQCFAMAIPFVWNTLLSSVCITEYLSLFEFPLKCHLLMEIFSIHLGYAGEACVRLQEGTVSQSMSSHLCIQRCHVGSQNHP